MDKGMHDCAGDEGSVQQGAVAGKYAEQAEHLGEEQETRLHPTRQSPSRRLSLRPTVGGRQCIEASDQITLLITSTYPT